MIEQENAARAFPVIGAAQGIDIDRIWPAVNGMQPAVTRCLRDLFGFNVLTNCGQRGSGWVSIT
jgi:hypothetical protein